MATIEEHAKTVFSGIIPSRTDLLDKALRQLSPEHFPERIQQKLFSILERYADQTSGVIPYKHLDDMLRGRADAGQIQLYLESYKLYEETKVTDSDFIWSVQQLREIAAEKATGEAITEAMGVLRNGMEISPGEVIRGHNDAREFLLSQFSSIDREMVAQDAPEGDLKDETVDILQDYADRKADRENGHSGGITFGISELDAKITGIQKGELAIVAASSSDGKSSLCVQLAWSAAVEQGKNVVFLTTETLRPQIRRKLVARHSKLPIFDMPDGLNTRDLKQGTLTEDQEEKLKSVASDLTKNPEYGRLYIAQVPRSSTISSLEQRLYRIQRKFDIDLVVMDYLSLLVSERKRQSTREELAAIMKEAKQVSATFNHGAGVPFVSPWQVTRAAREEADKNGMYSSAALSETAEATNSADVIISLLAPSDNTSRRAEVTVQVLKNRDGETANGMIVSVDYATSWFKSQAGSVFSPAAGTPGGLLPPTDSLLGDY